jgi:hypothetical protein
MGCHLLQRKSMTSLFRSTTALRQERSLKIQQLKQRGGPADVFNRTRRKSAARRFFEPKSQSRGIRSIARLQWDR